MNSEDVKGNYYQKGFEDFLNDENSIKSYSLVFFGEEIC